MGTMRHLLYFTLLMALGTADTLGQKPDSVLPLRDALRIGLTNYSRLKTKQDLVHASAMEVQAAKQDGLPDLTVGAESAYGTLDGMNGLASGQPGLITLTSGPVAVTQNWNAAFGALYLTNINWNLFSFGLQRSHVAEAKGQYRQDQQDLAQEQFQQQVRVAGAYLSLLAAQRVRIAMEENLRRAMQLREVILERTVNGLNPGVDSSIANTEVSNARLSLIDAQNYEQTQDNQLCIQMGISPQLLSVDTTFSLRPPGNLLSGTTPNVSGNPTLQFLASQVKTSDLQATYLRKTGLPRVSLFAVGQDRGSGFGSNYSINPADYSNNFFHGLQPVRANYLVGVGLAWDITDFSRSRSRSSAQRYRSKAFQDEYELEQSKLVNQLALSDQQIANAMAKYNETPVQLRSAQDAYRQKEALYENGLNNIVEVTQTLFLLNRAEIDRDVACNAVWQAVLFKAGTAGDLNLFLQQF